MSVYGVHPTRYGNLNNEQLYSMFRESSYSKLDESEKLDLLQETVNRDSLERGEIGAPEVRFADLPANESGNASNGVINVNRNMAVNGVQAYVSLLARLGLSSEQMNCIMKTIVNQGSIVKSEEDARSIIDDLALFELPIDIRNQFICDNAEYFFNDYSREIHQVFVALCQKYGKKEGFAYLKEHPEYIRFGVKAIK